MWIIGDMLVILQQGDGDVAFQKGVGIIRKQLFQSQNAFPILFYGFERVSAPKLVKAIHFFFGMGWLLCKAQRICN